MLFAALRADLPIVPFSGPKLLEQRHLHSPDPHGINNRSITLFTRFPSPDPGGWVRVGACRCSPGDFPDRRGQCTNQIGPAHADLGTKRASSHTFRVRTAVNIALRQGGAAARNSSHDSWRTTPGSGDDENGILPGSVVTCAHRSIAQDSGRRSRSAFGRRSRSARRFSPVGWPPDSSAIRSPSATGGFLWAGRRYCSPQCGTARHSGSSAGTRQDCRRGRRHTLLLKRVRNPSTATRSMSGCSRSTSAWRCLRPPPGG